MKKALVVDDSKTARLTLKKKLEQFQITADMAESGEEALQYLKQYTPDVIFMDVMMGGMSGYEATLAITRNPGTATVPVIMCTSKDTPEDREEAENNGARGFLVKPITDDQLARALQRLARAAPTPTPVPEIEPVPAMPTADLETLVRNLVEQHMLQIAERAAHQIVQETLVTRLGILEDKVSTLAKTATVAASHTAHPQAATLSPEYLRRLEEQVHHHLQQWSTQEQTRYRDHERQLHQQVQQLAERAAEAAVAKTQPAPAPAPATSPLVWVALVLALAGIGVGVAALVM